MKTFNSMRELDAEKKKLARRRSELEKNMGNNLKQVKERLNPANLFTKERMRNRMGRIVMNMLGKIFRTKQ